MLVGSVLSGLVVARLKRPVGAVSADGVPSVLVSASEALWRDPVAAREWFETQGIVPGKSFDVGQASRRREAIEGWARANGCTREDMPQLLDWHRVNALGLDAWQSAATRERFEARG